jgi:hypothetical protein
VTKRSKVRAPRISDYEDDDIFSLALFLTDLIATIQPTVDKATTFELLFAMLQEEVTEEVAAYYGNLIRMTSFNTSVGETH